MTDTKPEKEKQNAKQMPQSYYCRHMFAGLCGYENERVLVDADTMKAMMPSLMNKPVYVEHQKVDINNLQQQADGYITESFYNELDGWLWAKFIVVSDAGHKAIADGWAVSNAYIPTKWGAGGTFHNVEYTRAIADGRFTHLALVPKPRYESACIFTPDEFKVYQADKKNQLNELHNSKTESGVKKMKFFKTKKEEVTTVDQETMVELENGASVSVGDMMAEYLNAKKNEADEAAAKDKKEDEKINMEQKICVGEEEMTLKELINRYSAMSNKKNAKKNSEDADKDAKDKADKENESDADEDDKENKNAADAAAKAAAAANKKDHMQELLNAANAKSAPTEFVETSLDHIARGQKLYGSNK
jgi:hypothetical protein